MYIRYIGIGHTHTHYDIHDLDDDSTEGQLKGGSARGAGTRACRVGSGDGCAAMG